MEQKLWFGIFFAVVLLHSNRRAQVQCIGCIFLRDDLSIRCQNTSLEDIGESLHILTMVVHNKPAIIDIEDCGGAKELTPIFHRMNASIETVRIRRSGVRTMHMDTFIPLSSTLRNLDLSHNSLRAVPEALGVLWSLETLNLQHNKIVFLRPTSVFDGLPNLRELNLGNNYIGQAEERTEELTSQHGYQLKGTLTMDDFNLGHAVRSLESLNLRGNRLVSIPVQVSNYSLPELRYLDLSENVISKMDELSSTLLPKLQYLDFHSNRLQTIPFYSMPISLQYLELTENPFHCDCGALWLFDWYTTNSTAIHLPTCHSPEAFRYTPLNQVNWTSTCPDDNSTFRFRYMAKRFQDYDVIQLVSSATTITVSWKVKMTEEAEDKKWTVVYRRANDSPYQMTLSSGPLRSIKGNSGDETILTERIPNLKPSTVYIICIAVIQSDKYTIEPNKCQKTATKSYKEVGKFERQDASEKASASLFTAENIKTVLEDVTVSSEAIAIRWKLKMLVSPKNIASDATSVRHEWTIRIRRTGSDNFTDIPVFDITSGTETHEQLYEYEIPDITPHTHYDVCLVDVDHRPLNDKTGTIAPGDKNNVALSCRTVLTSSNYGLYATEIAAISLACAICLIVIAVTLYLCRQKRLLRWKPKKWRSWLTKTVSNNNKERPQPIGGIKYPTATIPRVRCEPRSNVHNTTDAKMVGTWNSVRNPYYKDFPQTNFPDPMGDGYKQALTSVTIYRSGFSEC